MPFENTIVIVTLDGVALKELIEYLTVNSTPHPISGIQLVLNRDGTLNSSSIRGNAIDFEKKYRVATSNFLAGGGDGMIFFKSDHTPLDTGYLIRNAMTDYFKRTDTLRTKPDNRFYQIGQ
jgi:2',3'-cyclic-nucleotide 2'-phosphodiesterase (5'-nucleotidase family)